MRATRSTGQRRPLTVGAPPSRAGSTSTRSSPKLGREPAAAAQHVVAEVEQLGLDHQLLAGPPRLDVLAVQLLDDHAAIAPPPWRAISVSRDGRSSVVKRIGNLGVWQDQAIDELLEEPDETDRIAALVRRGWLDL